MRSARRQGDRSFPVVGEVSAEIPRRLSSQTIIRLASNVLSSADLLAPGCTGGALRRVRSQRAPGPSGPRCRTSISRTTKIPASTAPSERQTARQIASVPPDRRDPVILGGDLLQDLCSEGGKRGWSEPPRLRAAHAGQLEFITLRQRSHPTTCRCMRTSSETRASPSYLDRRLPMFRCRRMHRHVVGASAAAG